MKLIKLSADHYVIVDDSEIKEGDWCHLGETSLFNGGIGIVNKNVIEDNGKNGMIFKKITHSTTPLEYTTEDHLQWDKIKRLSLSEVKELIGEGVDVINAKDKYLQKVKEEVKDCPQHDRIYILGSSDLAFTEGYNQAIKDSKDKKYTEEDMRAVFTHGFLLGVDRGDYSRDMEDRAMSHYTEAKTQWEVEFIDGKLKLK